MLFKSDEQIASQRIERNITLDETLKPLWKITYYSGILLDWCVPLPNKNVFNRIVQYFTISLSFLMCSFIMLFELAQLLKEFETQLNFIAIIPTLIWFAPLPINTITQLHYIWKRNDFLRFFEDWRKLEKETCLNSCIVICKSKKLHVILYLVYIAMTIASLLSLSFEIQRNPEAPYVLYSYDIVRQYFSLLFIGAIHILVILLVWIFLSLSDFVPAFMYFHAARVVTSLENQLKSIVEKSALTKTELFVPESVSRGLCNKVYPFKQSLQPLKKLDVSIRLSWRLLEKVIEMVDRANFLFGGIVVACQGSALFMIVVLIYSVLYNLENALQVGFTGPIVPYTLNAIALAFRVVSCSLISSQLNRSAEKLRTSLSYLLSKYWDQMAKQDRELLRSLLLRLQSNDLMASPLGLYNITSSSLLSTFGLIVSYLIVLLQSK